MRAAEVHDEAADLGSGDVVEHRREADTHRRNAIRERGMPAIRRERCGLRGRGTVWSSSALRFGTRATRR
jgi:hypothetical protein